MDVEAPNVASSSSLVELFPHEPTLEGGEDESLEWLSIYVEDCLSSSTSYTNLPALKPTPTTTTNHTTPKPKSPPPSSSTAIRKKRSLAAVISRTDEQHYVSCFLDPPLLNQTQWLAESELIFPKKDQDQELGQAQELGQVQEKKSKESASADSELQAEQPVKRCSHCMSFKTPQWRAGPLGPKTLCNACGVRFKSGRLLPEYRPAKSPTFVSYKHSNSHKKVMQLRMAVPSPHPAN